MVSNVQFFITDIEDKILFYNLRWTSDYSPPRFVPLLYVGKDFAAGKHCTLPFNLCYPS